MLFFELGVFILDEKSDSMLLLCLNSTTLCIISYSGHPYLPYLATSGLDFTAKLWIPTGMQRPIADKQSEIFKEVNVSLMKSYKYLLI